MLFGYGSGSLVIFHLHTYSRSCPRIQTVYYVYESTAVDETLRATMSLDPFALLISFFL